MKISKVQQTKRNKDRYSIYIDGEYTLAVSEDVLIKYQLFKDREITAEELEEVQEAEAHHRLYASALNYLSYGLRSERQVREHIQSRFNKDFKGDMPEEQMTAIIDRLKSLSLLNDLAYAQAYVRTQHQLQGKGPRRIEQELIQKGIGEHLIQEALEEITEEETLEEGIALAEKYVLTQTREPEQKIREKLYQYLLRKGYVNEMIQVIMDTVTIEVEEEHQARLLEKEAEKQSRRLSRRYTGRDLEQRLIQSLLRKGFPYSDITAWLEERREE